MGIPDGAALSFQVGGGGWEFHYHSLPGVENLIEQINHYPPDKSQGNQLRYSLDSDLSSG